MNCEVCGREVQGSLEVSDGELDDGTWLVVISSTPDRDWIVCDSCNKLVCHDCCEHPKTGYCDQCIKDFHLFDERMFERDSSLEEADDPASTNRIMSRFGAKLDGFTEAEARSKIGKAVRSRVTFAAVPKGTKGSVVTIDDFGTGCEPAPN